MKTKLKQTGDQLAIVIPKEYVDQFHLKPDQTIDIEGSKDGIYVQLKSVLDEVIASIPEGEGVELFEGMVQLMKDQNVDLYK